MKTISSLNKVDDFVARQIATIIPLAIGIVVSLIASFSNSGEHCASVITDFESNNRLSVTKMQPLTCHPEARGLCALCCNE